MKKNFLLYLDQQEIFEALSDEEAGKIIKEIFNYASTGEVKISGLLRAIFMGIKITIDRDNESWQKKCDNNKENGKLGGRPKNDNRTVILKTERLSEEPRKTERLSEEPRKTERLISKPKKPDSDSDSDSDSDLLKEEINKEEKPYLKNFEKAIHKPKTKEDSVTTETLNFIMRQYNSHFPATFQINGQYNHNFWMAKKRELEGMSVKEIDEYLCLPMTKIRDDGMFISTAYT